MVAARGCAGAARGAALTGVAHKKRAGVSRLFIRSAGSECLRYSLASIFVMAVMAASVVMFASVAIVLAVVHLPLA